MTDLSPELAALEQARQAFEEEISVLAHDLSGPLARVVNCLQLIKDLLAMQEYATIPQVLEIALNSAQAQLNNIEVLQDITRLSSGLKLPHNGNATLEAALEGAQNDLRELFEEAHAHYSTDLPPDLPATVADAAVLRRVCFNLLENALRHVPQGGTIHVSASCEAGALTVRVTDNGKGVAAEHQARIFEKFYRVPSSPLRGKRGMGLGLPFTKLAVEAYGGSLWFEPAPNGGAVFCFRLPIAEAQP